jgi:hypothetical protein
MRCFSSLFFVDSDFTGEEMGRALSQVLLRTTVAGAQKISRTMAPRRFYFRVAQFSPQPRWSEDLDPMASYLLTFPTVHDGSDVVRILVATDILAEADSKGRLSIWYSDGTSAFFRTIVEISDDDDLLDELRNAGWTIEPAPAGVYQHPPMDDQPADDIP